MGTYFPVPCSPFEKIPIQGDSITINTAGKILVLPSGNSAILPSFNEYTLNSNRLTVAESPFGGLKGAGSPDYAVGTVTTPTTGVYITDTGGTNSTPTMPAGKLKELNLLTVDTSLKTITEEFVISNTNTANSPVNLNISDDLTGWSVDIGDVPTLSFDTGDKTAGNGSISLNANAGAGGNGSLVIKKTVPLNLSGKDFLSFDLKSTRAGNCYLYVNSGTDSKYYSFVGAVTTDTWLRFNVPINVPAGVNGCVSVSAGFNPANITKIYIGVTNLGVGNNATIKVDNINSDVGLSSNAEIQVPDYLADSSVIVQCWNGSSYQTCRICKLDSTFSDVSTTPTNLKFLDGSKADDIYGSGLGRGVFPKGISGATVTGNNSQTMTYSANKGTKYRIGKMIKLPPSDSGRTNFNKIRLKFIIYYTDINGNSISDMSGNGKTGTITGTIVKKVDGVFYDSVDDRVTIPTINSLLSVQGYTVVAEVTPADFSTNYYDRHIISAMSSDGFHFRVGNGKLNFVVIETGGTTVAHSGVASLTAGTRYILIMTLTPTALKGYINGTLDNTTTTTNTWNIVPTTAPIIGNYAGDTARVFHGTIHNLAFYNSVWDQTQITAYIMSKTVPSNPVFKIQPVALNSGSTTYEFEDSTNASYGLQNLSKPFIALFDPASNCIDFFLFTHRPKHLIRKRNDTGNVYELTLYPGNGSIYRGRITHADLTTDSNSNLIPNCLESDIEGSVTKFLSCYGMVL